MNPPLPQDTRRTYRRLLRYLQGFGAAFRLGILGSVVFAATQSAFLWFLKVFLDGAFFKHDPRVLHGCR